MLAVLGLGSNLGDREGILRSALRMIATSKGIALLRSSPIYETAAVGPPQGDYLNGAALVKTSLSPRELLQRGHAIEVAHGRIRPERGRFGPRTLDVDVLWIDGVVIDERPDLVVPHYALQDRPFALRPLLDVVPSAVDPRTGVPLSALAAANVPLRSILHHHV